MTGERHRSLFRSAIAPVIVLAGFLAAVGCDRPPASHAVEGEARPPSVQRIHPERQTLRQTFEQPASVAAFQETPIFAKIAGYVRKVHKDIGDHVKAGEILAELSVPEMVEEVHRKEALVQQAEAGVEQARKALAATEASLQSARAQVKEAEAGKARAQANVDRSRAQFKRYQGATTGGVIDRDALDEARFQQEAAQAALQEIEAKVHSAEALLHEAQARRDRAQADVAASRAQVQVAVADRNQYQALLSYAKVTAPFDGVLTARAVDEGHLLQPAASGAKGEPLFVIMQVDPVRVFLDVPETDAALVHTGMPAQVRLQALPGLEVPGQVTRMAWALDPRTRTLRTEVDLPNRSGQLRPGMYAHVALIREKSRAWAIPAAAVVQQGESAAVFRIDDGKVFRLPVRLGIRQGNVVEILQKQSAPAKDGQPARWEDLSGEESFAANAAGLADGQTVTETATR